ncbi:hypothetical protein GCM10027299_03280 [Larkinella ripae]
MPQTPEEIGQLIKQLRKQRNMTQTELGEKLGIKKSSVVSYEKGRSNFTVDTLQRIADALGADLTINLAFKTK